MTLFEDVQERQGWTDDTLMNLAIDFIYVNGLHNRFIQFLEDVAADENTWELEDFGTG